MAARASTPATALRGGSPQRRVADTARTGIALLGVLVGLMWILEVVNTLDSNGLDSDGIWARNIGRLWGILTAPFLHASFAHLIGNTIPLVFIGGVIALGGALRLGSVTTIVILLGGLGTWLIAPAHSYTIGASGLVFGYATYVLARGFFDRSIWEVVVGVGVAVIWGGALLASLVPQPGISWQGHLCGAIAGLLAAWLLARQRSERSRTARVATRAGTP